MARLRESSPDRPEPPADATFRRSLIAAAALNSGAIEGLHGAGRELTRSVIEHAADWQPIVRQAEGSKAEAFVAAGIEGFDMALDIATGAEPLSEVWIRSVHAVVCEPQNTVPLFSDVRGERVGRDVPFEKGRYKTGPNNVELLDGSVHWYCPPEEVPIEMGRLVETLRSPEFAAAHPILQTAFAHYAFVAVHPFQDGNGRVARLLASIYLLGAASIPLFIYDDERLPYFDALESADRGDRQVFINFIERVALDTLAVATELARAPVSPLTLRSPKERIAQDVKVSAERLVQLVASEFETAGDQIAPGAGMSKRWQNVGFASTERGVDNRWSVGADTVRLRLESNETQAGADRYFRVFAGESVADPSPVAVSVNGAPPELEFRLDELHPAITSRAHVRVAAFVQRVVGELVAEAQAAIDARGG